MDVKIGVTPISVMAVVNRTPARKNRMKKAKAYGSIAVTRLPNGNFIFHFHLVKKAPSQHIILVN